jgi:hypothetical protein
MSDTQPIDLNSAALGIGRHVSGIADPFNGHVDEFRISHVQGPDGWIETTRNNMSEPGAFAAAGAEEQKAGEPPPLAGARVVVCLMTRGHRRGDQQRLRPVRRIDEIRISIVIRSETWLKATYRHLSAPTSFLSAGAEEMEGGGSAPAPAGRHDGSHVRRMHRLRSTTAIDPQPIDLELPVIGMYFA